MAPEVLQLLKDYGPALLAGVGTVFTTLLGTLMALGRIAWKRHMAFISSQTKAIAQLHKDLAADKESSQQEHGRIWSAVQAFRAESQLTKNSMEHLKSGLLSSEGAMKHQTSRIDAYIERMGQLDAKIEAIFRWLDAQKVLEKRATDARP